MPEYFREIAAWGHPSLTKKVSDALTAMSALRDTGRDGSDFHAALSEGLGVAEAGLGLSDERLDDVPFREVALDVDDDLHYVEVVVPVEYWPTREDLLYGVPAFNHSPCNAEASIWFAAFLTYDLDDWGEEEPAFVLEWPLTARTRVSVPPEIEDALVVGALLRDAMLEVEALAAAIEGSDLLSDVADQV